ncbi:SpoIIE family protein phosphatase [Defluviitalea phaphyphila]|uniref:SpoIIE family protein phosphatase n=1 Tax=Defluviitalea phaphyphila TaxID=1473580 RepID=UPI000730E6C2|nr:SpoIIE family protein phosphatase [Defluviitalea phaphyphila]
MSYYIDVAYNSIYKEGEELCGDHVEITRIEDGIIIVMADGLGSGVKANILATLTSKIAVTMLKEGASLDETVDTIIHTLPECQIRKLAYSTFTIIKVYNDGKIYIAEYDNPPFFLFHSGVDRVVKKQKNIINKKTILESRFTIDDKDLLVVVSDGAIHAGVGKLLNLGWRWENINDYLRDLSIVEKNSKDITGNLLGVCENLYDGKPGDDTTVITIKLRKPEVVNLFTGPPKKREDDSKVIKELMNKKGKIVICGGTTANIASRELNREIIVDTNSYTKNLPPIAKIEGIDLVTEGVLTLNQCVEIIKKYINTSCYSELNKIEGDDGATKLARLLINDCTHLNLWVGKAINPAHQNPDFPMDFNIKIKIVNELVECMKKLGKEVTIKYV